MEILKAQFMKLLGRSEWQAFLIAVVVAFLNHRYAFGLSEAEVVGMFLGSGAYAVSRGVAKHGKLSVEAIPGMFTHDSKSGKPSDVDTEK